MTDDRKIQSVDDLAKMVVDVATESGTRYLRPLAPLLAIDELVKASSKIAIETLVECLKRGGFLRTEQERLAAVRASLEATHVD